MDDIIGQEFGYLTVIKYVGGRYRKYLCLCACGKETLKGRYLLINGKSKSCGCMKSKLISDAITKHGKSGTPEYNTWKSMIDRCYNQANDHYKHYGGRGIIVCDRWRYSFENFLNDMGLRPGPEYSIDRKNNDLGYHPENCRWADRKTQANNRSDNVRLTNDFGETKTVAQWAEILGCKSQTIISRLNRGWSEHKSVTTPVKEVKEKSELMTLTFEGETRIISDWAIEMGLSSDAIRYRIKKGWDVEKILTTPVERYRS